MAPASIVVRLTPQLVAGYDTYGFRVSETGRHELPEIVEGVKKGCSKEGEKEKIRYEVEKSDYPANEFFLGGKIVKDMDEETLTALEASGVTLDRNPQRLLKKVAKKALG